MSVSVVLNDRQVKLLFKSFNNYYYLKDTLTQKVTSNIFDTYTSEGKSGGLCTRGYKNIERYPNITTKSTAAYYNGNIVEFSHKKI